MINPDRKLTEFLIQKYDLSNDNQPTLKDLWNYLRADFGMVVYTSGKSLDEYSEIISEDLLLGFGIKTKKV